MNEDEIGTDKINIEEILTQEVAAEEQLEVTYPPKTIPDIISQEGGINGQKRVQTGANHQQAQGS